MDIDIDFADRSIVLDSLEHIKAMRVEKDNSITHHNTGIYFHHIPHNVVTNLANIDYKAAEDRGYFKIDFLNVSLYNDIRDEHHLIELMNQEPLWDLLEQDDFANMLFHVNGHGSILRQMKPKSVEQLAAILAMIRPAKRYLVGKPWDQVMKEVWTRPDTDEYFFKKSHATAYAVVIVVQMNLICENVKSD